MKSEWHPCIRPALNKKLFPVHRPSGLKRADWNFFLLILKIFLFVFLHFPLYILVHKKRNWGGGGGGRNSQPPDLPFFCPPGLQETFFYLRVALLRSPCDRWGLAGLRGFCVCGGGVWGGGEGGEGVSLGGGGEISGVIEPEYRDTVIINNLIAVSVETRPGDPSRRHLVLMCSHVIRCWGI